MRRAEERRNVLFDAEREMPQQIENAAEGKHTKTGERGLVTRRYRRVPMPPATRLRYVPTMTIAATATNSGVENRVEGRA